MTKVIRVGAKDINKFFKFFEKTLKEKYFLYPKENANYLMNVGLPKKTKFRKDILSGQRPLYLIFEKKKLAGYLLTTKDFAGVTLGHWLAVDKEYQNKGLATKLLKVWEEDSLRNGAHAIHLWTTENDVGFYKKKGFILGGKFEKAWLGLDHYFFYKIIGKPNTKKYI